jgi:23S rRNA pseudouridine2605 synthase
MSRRNRPSRSSHTRPHPRRRNRRFDQSPHGDADANPRLQKILAAAGLGSRRQCEELIVEGRVEVDRRIVKALGTRVDPLHHEIRVDGEPLPRPKRQYFLLNKPMGVVSTARDPAGRPRVIDLIKSHHRLFPVGRLDVSSEGMILVTNDGELANLLTHPRYEVEKTYLAKIAGAPAHDVLAQLQRGVHLAEGFAHAKRVRIKSQQKQSAVLEIVLDEGRNREVRRLLARVGHKVLRLKRIAIGSLRLGDLAPGEYRPLRGDEVRELKQSALEARRKAKHQPQSSKPAGAKAPAKPELSRPPTWPSLSETRNRDNERHDNAPRHTGTIIGATDDDGDADSQNSGRAANDESPRVESKPRIPLVKPLIDVRRGIFPGSHDDDDFADDEFGDESSHSVPAPGKRDTDAGSQTYGKQRDRRRRRGGKPGDSPQSSIRHGKKLSQKGGQRAESQMRTRGSKQQFRPGTTAHESKGRNGGKRRRR